MKKQESLFWADQLAKKIIERKKFYFTESKVPKLKKWSVKSSSSLSGVLHIGRLSDLIRGEAVYHALKDAGFPVEFIYVTEDMDPLRKIPKGVPKEFEKYIGFPVSDVPDPEGCHKSYDEHHLEHFLNTAMDFLSTKPKVFSMRKEYQKGSFNGSIKKLMKGRQTVLEIINKFKETPLGEDWIPWQPICENCGNMQTTKAISFDGKKVEYICQDYKFETQTAKGCGHNGFSDLSKANGKMPWKSEWAMQWKHWNVCSEGAGKEYESKNSAFWINAEICEKALEFPAPEPIFYEHILIGGIKMSASLGNVVYPSDWLKYSRAETLRLLYLKRLMKTRSFSWQDIPLLELELDRLAENVSQKKGVEKEQIQNKRLLKFVETKKRKITAPQLDFSTALMVGQLFSDPEKAFAKVREMGLAGPKEKEFVLERLEKARNYANEHLSEEQKTVFVPPQKIDSSKINSAAKSLLPEIADKIEKAKNAEEIQNLVYNTAKENNVQPKQLFSSLYQAILGKERGPRLGSLIFAFGREKVAARLREIK
ncbi:MAG: lysine--tRNA ligase [Candidatus Diapherotrites archaeon]|nr:lysine--tRNA ligase [Candidatus Diapherotrites archaeon]